jgi:uncharacterized protein DUF1353
MKSYLTRRESLGVIGSFLALPIAGCTTIPRDQIGNGKLYGRLRVEWIRQDQFVYIPTDEPLTYEPSFMNIKIAPERMYTDGGSIPRVFWGIPGLSPWGLGPAYIIHDWLFQAHRCQYAVPEANFNFKQSAIALAEVGKALIASGLIDNDLLDEVVWAVSTRYAKGKWDTPKTPKECEKPPSLRTMAREGAVTVANFKIPPQRY